MNLMPEIMTRGLLLEDFLLNFLLDTIFYSIYYDLLRKDIDPLIDTPSAKCDF